MGVHGTTGISQVRLDLRVEATCSRRITARPTHSIDFQVRSRLRDDVGGGACCEEQRDTDLCEFGLQDAQRSCARSERLLPAGVGPGHRRRGTL